MSTTTHADRRSNPDDGTEQKVIADISMSLDGYVTGAGPGGPRPVRRRQRT